MLFLSHPRFAFVLLTAAISFSQLAHGEELAKLHTILESDAGVREKQVACKQLALVGTADSVAVLAGLLADDALAHAARFALEGIPDPEADAALLDSLDRLEGRYQIGAINSIGVRRDSKAVPRLTALLSDANPETVAAAEAALGNIASVTAVSTLLKRLAEGGDAVESTAVACLAAGEKLVAGNQSTKAIEVYDAVRSAPVPRPLKIAATWSAIRARRAKAAPLIEELLAGDDDALFAIALQATRGPIANSVSQTLVNTLPTAQPDRQAQIIMTLGDLGNTDALPAISPLISSDSAVVQLAAIGAMKQLGDRSVVDALLKVASQNNQAAADAARDALNAFSGADVDSLLADRLKASGADALLISLAGSRRIAAAAPELWSATESRNESVRHAALQALGEIIELNEIDRLIEKALSPATQRDAEVTIAALTRVCMRAPDREATVEQVSDQFAEAPPASRMILFELLRVIGGETALKIVVTGARDSNDVVQDAATRALGRWLTADVAPELLELAKELKARKYRIRTMRAFIRIIQQFGLPADQRLEMARRAFEAAERDDERILIINALLRFPNPDSLALTTDQLIQPALRDTAAQIALYMVDFINDKEAVRTAMRKISESDASPALVKQAKAVLAAQ